VIDLHSHLLPGVDDGSKSVEQSVAVLTTMRDGGVTGVCLTPHHTVSRIGQGIPESHDAAFRELSRQAPHGIQLYRGVELMLDRPVREDMFSGPGLTLGGTRSILVEFTRFATAPAVSNALMQIVRLGFIPVLAHPERYAATTPTAAWQWKSLGAVLQVDATTIFQPGRRGQRARELLAHGLADIMAADNHGDGRSVLVPYRLLCEQGGEHVADLLARKNPGAILAQQPLDPVPPLQIKPGLLVRLKELFGTEE